MSMLDAAAVDSIVFIDDCSGNGGIKVGYYGSINEASNWISQRLYTRPWTKASNREREAALAEATQAINTLRYWGCKTDADQDNEFPRNGSSTVPIAVRRATYEIAIMLLDGTDIEKEVKGLMVVATGYSSARIQYNRTVAQEHLRNGIPSYRAWELLIPYMADPQRVAIIRKS